AATSRPLAAFPNPAPLAQLLQSRWRFLLERTGDLPLRTWTPEGPLANPRRAFSFGEPLRLSPATGLRRAAFLGWHRRTHNPLRLRWVRLVPEARQSFSPRRASSC